MKFASVLQKLTVTAMLVLFAVATEAQAGPLSGLNGGLNGNVTFGVSPSMTEFNNALYIAYQPNGSDGISVGTTTNGSTVTYLSSIPGYLIASSTSPSITVWNSELVVAFAAKNTNQLFLSYSNNNGASFTTPTPVAGYTVANSSPTLAVYNNQLWITFVENLSGTSTTVTSFATSDGVNFTLENVCTGYQNSQPEPQTGATVGVANFANMMWFAYQAQGNWNHALVYCSAGNGQPSYYYLPGVKVGSGVSAAVYYGGLYLNYKDYNSHGLTITEVYPNASYTNGSPYSDNQINGNQEINPSAAVLGDYYWVSYTSNNGSHNMVWTNDIPGD